MQEYEIYYDEIKEDGYWHGIFFLPTGSSRNLIKYLEEAESDYPFNCRLHFANCGKNDPEDSMRTLLTESYISIGCASLQSQKFEEYPVKAKVGRHLKLIAPICAKFAVYRVSPEVMRACNENRNLIITQTLKSALKGAIHYLFPTEEDIMINKIFFEGAELQGVDDKKIMATLQKQVHNNIKKLPDNFVTQSSNHNNLSWNQEKKDSCILQLCDSMVGATRFCVVSNSSDHIRNKISKPIKGILGYADESLIRMRQSRYFRGFSLSEAGVDGDDWEFTNLKVKERINYGEQKSLFA